MNDIASRLTIGALLIGTAVLCWVGLGVSWALAKIKNPLHGDDL